MNSLNWNELEWDEAMPGMRRKVLHADEFTIVLMDLAPNLDLPHHSHHHEQVTRVQKASLAFTVNSKKAHLIFRGLPSRAVGIGFVLIPARQTTWQPARHNPRAMAPQSTPVPSTTTAVLSSNPKRPFR